ncbi:hypothetical protein SASPL_143657 [Salvia splendens]|uniref:Uncharacterized protein n=1 Tax=Salvia splendens TaxID=180675 RepID=A0A8X8WN19_SALSN|nr:hypothetical protein SASPL_143657 [Salvia splendens]
MSEIKGRIVSTTPTYNPGTCRLIRGFFDLLDEKALGFGWELMAGERTHLSGKPTQLRGENHRLEIITILPDEHWLFRELLWVEFKVESVAAGVPVVAMAQAMDQVTNAKLVEDSWRCGVRVVKGEIVEADEILRCLEMAMDGGDESREMRKNATKWRDLAREAADDGGSSQVNLKMFAEQKKFDV